MKNFKNTRALCLAFTLGLTALCCTVACITPALQAEARGGGGFGGGGGFRGGSFGGEGREEGGYRGDGGYHGDAERGWQTPGGESSGHNNESHASEGDLKAAADKSYYNNREEGLSTDGGFGRTTTEYAGTGMYRGSGNGTTHALASAGMADHGADVRNNFGRLDHGMFDRAWWGRHDGWWGYGGWGDGWWGGAGWGDLAGYWDMPDASEPVEYDYGDNITYQGDQVYYGSQPTATAAQYYQQAQTIAYAAPAIPTTTVNGLTQVSGDWKPLGVFSLTQAGDTNCNTIFQLAVNKAGVVSGNYYNTLNDQSTPIKGKVDKKNMRVAFTVGKNKDVVYDTGLANLLQPQSNILVHLNKAKTQQEMLVRLQPPKASSAQATP